MSRGHIELVHAPELPEHDWSIAGWPAQPRIKMLSGDPASGALTGLLRLPGGYRRPSGFIGGGDRADRARGLVARGRRDARLRLLRVRARRHDARPVVDRDRGPLLFFARDRTPDFVPHEGPNDVAGRIEIDTEARPWTESPIPGPSEGLLHKWLRLVEETGEMTHLCGDGPPLRLPNARVP